MTKTPPINPDFLITDEAALRALFAPTHPIAVTKSLDHLDKHARAFVARAPFLCIGTQSNLDTADVSQRGDPCGFVQVLDDKTLLIPDRPGNNRLDTLSNIIANPVVGLLFIIPGFDDTLRINGMAQITRDPALLAKLAVNDRAPTVAIVVTVREVFLHCAKAFRRSKLWDPAARQDRSAMPSLVTMILDQTAVAPTDPAEIRQNDAALEQDYQSSMY